MTAFFDYKLTKNRARVQGNTTAITYIRMSPCAFVEKFYNINYEVELVYSACNEHRRRKGGNDP